MEEIAPVKCKPRQLVIEELRNISEQTHTLPTDSYICLNHGYYFENKKTLKEPFSCFTHRSSSLREEFLVNVNGGFGNFLLSKSFARELERKITNPKSSSRRHPANRFSITGAPLKHLVWVAKHRVFVAFTEDKQLVVYSDTGQACQLLSSPTLCSSPLLSMLYLDDTDELIGGGTGELLFFKLLISGESTARHLFLNSDKTKILRQMLELQDSYGFRKDDWVKKLKLCERGRPLLVALCSESIIAIDYKKRVCAWTVRLLIPTNDFHPAGNCSESMHQAHTKSETLNEGSIYHIHGHTIITDCIISTKFEYFITSGTEGLIKLWEKVNFKFIATLKGHQIAIVSLALLPHHGALVSGSQKGVIKIWCLETFTVTQHIDTSNPLVDIVLGGNPDFLFLIGIQKIKFYRLHRVHSLFTAAHSQVASLFKIHGDVARKVAGKVVMSLEDGSIALLSPSVGHTLTIAYPLNTFQVFRELCYDAIYDALFATLQNGDVIQFDCSSNPSRPLRRLVPEIEFDQAVLCLTSLYMNLPERACVVLGGLRSGQIALVHPTNFTMKTTQAHLDHLRFLTSPTNIHLEAGDKRVDNVTGTIRLIRALVSVGHSSVRTWNIKVKKKLFETKSLWELTLEPDKNIILPQNMMEVVEFTSFSDRLCAASSSNRLLIFEFDSKEKQIFECLSSAESTDQAITWWSSHKDDSHTEVITGLDCSATLSCVASSSTDGFVKIWNPQAKLLREVCFLPQTVTAVCFLNQIDLLVGAEKRLCLLECSNFLTKPWLDSLNLLNMPLYDDIVEPGLPYQDDIIVLTNAEQLRTASLNAENRDSDARFLSDSALNSNLLASTSTELNSSMLPAVPDAQENNATEKSLNFPVYDKQKKRLRLLNTFIPFIKLHKSGKSRKILNKWKEMCQKMEKDGSSKISRTELLPTESMEQTIREKIQNQATTHTSSSFDQNQMTTHTSSSISSSLKHNRPVAPDCFIPNSVIRKKFHSFSDFVADERSFHVIEATAIPSDFDNQQISSNESLEYNVKFFSSKFNSSFFKMSQKSLSDSRSQVDESLSEFQNLFSRAKLRGDQQIYEENSSQCFPKNTSTNFFDDLNKSSILNGVEKFNGLLQMIARSRWFVHQIEELTPDCIGEHLLNYLSAAPDVGTHREILSCLAMILNSFPVTSEKSCKSISTEMKKKIQKHLAESMVMACNRSRFVLNILEAILNGIPLDELIENQVFQLLAHPNELVKEKAHLIIDSSEHAKKKNSLILDNSIDFTSSNENEVNKKTSEEDGSASPISTSSRTIDDDKSCFDINDSNLVDIKPLKSKRSLVLTLYQTKRKECENRKVARKIKKREIARKGSESDKKIHRKTRKTEKRQLIAITDISEILKISSKPETNSVDMNKCDLPNICNLNFFESNNENIEKEQKRIQNLISKKPMRIKEAHLTTSSALESKVTVKVKKQKITLDDGWRLAINALRQKRLRNLLPPLTVDQPSCADQQRCSLIGNLVHESTAKRERLTTRCFFDWKPPSCSCIASPRHSITCEFGRIKVMWTNRLVAQSTGHIPDKERQQATSAQTKT